MAIGTPTLHSTASGSTSATSASFTPTTGDKLLVYVSARKGTSAPAALSLSDSLGGSWTQIYDQVYDAGTNPRFRIALYAQDATGSAMTVTATVSDAQSTGIIVVGVSGVGTDFTNQILDVNLSGDPTCTLPNTPDSTSGVIGFYAASATNNVTQVAGFTELTEFTANTNMRMEAAYDVSSPAQTLSWTSTNVLSLGLTVELKVPSAGGGITGTASIHEDDDTVSSTGTVIIKGVASITEDNDTSTITATLSLSGTLSVTEADDQMFSTATIKISGSLSVTEDDDTILASGGASPISGTLSVTEDNDTISATGTLKLVGTLSVTEANDTVVSTGTLKITGSLSITENDDTIVSTGINPDTPLPVVVSGRSSIGFRLGIYF